MNIDAIVIPCSKNKKTTPAEAEYLYVGPYYKACLDYAKKHTNKKNIYILSAKYGFIKLNDIIAPYNTKITKKIKQERRCFYINTAKQHNQEFSGFELTIYFLYSILYYVAILNDNHKEA